MTIPRITEIIGYSAQTSAPNEQPRWGHFTADWADETQRLFEKWLAEHDAQVLATERAEYTWQVLTGGTSRYPLAIIGAYRSRFEADAVAHAWNETNNKHGIYYRVEEDA